MPRVRLDDVIPEAEQRAWLDSPRSDVAADEPVPPSTPDGEPESPSRFARLTADQRFADVIPLLREYVAWTIPFPLRTEREFWALSALPKTNAAWFPRLFTLSVNQLETLYVYRPRHDPDSLGIRLNLAHESLTPADVDGLPGAELADYAVRPDVLAVNATHPDELRRILRLRPVVIAAARRLNLDLMRRGRTTFGRYHCPELADVAVGVIRPAPKALHPTGHGPSGGRPGDEPFGP